MYQKQDSSNWLPSLLIASLGAGIVTSAAIAGGQHPLHALVITAVAAGFALLCQRYNAI
ncbi:MAG: hypothetical protein HC910_16335 [Spirulinaceae cyanobacterium SM2_1_0]|nr:hypothetical protein [Spirulinaceae cyanobacterium SM2_1_0]